MKKLFLIANIFTLFILTSCSDDNSDSRSLHNEKFYYSFDFKIGDNEFAKRENQAIDGYISTSITSSVQLDPNMDFGTFSRFIRDVRPDVEILFIYEDLTDVSISIIDGEVISFGVPSYTNNDICSSCDRDENGNISDSTDCTRHGIRQCAFSTYQQWSTAKIIYQSLTGGSQQVFASCIGRNCLGW